MISFLLSVLISMSFKRSFLPTYLSSSFTNPERISRAVHQLIVSPVEQHSKKPDETRDRIVKLIGDLPRVELFARQKTPGWDIWGNELENDIEL